MSSRLSSGGSAGSGTVTSVALTTPGLLDTVSGSPIVGAGTLALSLKTQVQNTILAGPASGPDAAPTMRAAVAADIPSLDAGKITTGTFADARLATGITGSKISGALPNATLATSALTGTIAASQLAVSAPTSGQLGGLVTGNLSATAGILGSQLDAAAGITSGQITSVAASTLTGSIADARLSANVPLLNASNVFTTAGSSASSGTAILQQVAPTVTQTSTAGYTALDVNVTQSSTGSGLKRLLDLRVAGVTKCWVDSTGALTLQSTLAMISGATFKVGNTLLVNSANSTSFTMGGQSTTATGIFAFVSANNASNGMNAASGSQSWMSVAAAVTQSGTAGYTALLVNSTETSVGSGTKLLQDWQTGGTSKASIDDTGALAFSPATTTSAPSNGAGGALPANATGFATVTINGTARQICYW